MIVSIVVLLLTLGQSYALDNGLALTPPMGWMHWQRFRCITDCQLYPDECVSEKLFRDMTDRLVSDGYLSVGYNYIIIDDCWASMERDNNSRLQPDPDRFPSGIKALADYVHGKGLKFGIYADYGTKTCAGYPGSLDYLEIDANTFAEWEVDYLKLDACYSKGENYEKGYREMGDFLNKTGRPIVYSCSWPAYEEPNNIKSNYTALVETCNLWRSWDDIEDSWQNVTHIVRWYIENQDRLIPFAGKGHWNDPDMLLIGNYGLSYEQSKAQMIIWAILAAPLIMSVDLRTIKPEFKELLLHKEIIKINQDELAIQGRLFTSGKNKIDVWIKPITPVKFNSSSFAIGIVSNRVDGYPHRLNFTLSDLNITQADQYVIQDVLDSNLEERTVSLTDSIIVRVAPTGGCLFKAIPTATFPIVNFLF